MNPEEMKAYIAEGNFAAVVDATHPYAEVITENIKAAVQGMDIPYFRLKRETDTDGTGGKISCFDTNEACAEALEAVEGNILLTTGSKELAKYCVSENVRNRLYVRVLPGIESITLCMEQGIGGRHILALQGPFTTEMNEAMIRQYQIKCLVTKASGKTSGYGEKLEAAERAGIPVYVIGQPQKDEGYSFREVCRKLEVVCGRRIKQNNKLEIVLAGIGMGSRNSLTKEVSRAIEDADILLGAERMLTNYRPRLEKKPFYKAEQIILYLKEVQEKEFALKTGKVVVLFSGDSGFYSGCQALYKALQEEVAAGALDATVRIRASQVLIQHKLHAAATHAAPQSADEQWVAPLHADQIAVALHGFQRVITHRHQAQLAPLAQHTDAVFPRSQGIGIQRHQLAESHAAGIKELQNRHIAVRQPGWALLIGRHPQRQGKQLLHLVQRKVHRQALGSARQAHLCQRAGLQPLAPHQVFIKRAKRRKTQANCRSLKLLVQSLIQPGAENICPAGLPCIERLPRPAAEQQQGAVVSLHRAG